MEQEFARALANYDPVGDMQRAAANRQLQQLQGLQLQYAPQQFQQEQAYKSALTKLAQAQAAAEPEKAKAAEYLNEIRAELMKQKLIQAQNPVSPSDKKFAEEDAKTLVEHKKELDEVQPILETALNDLDKMDELYPQISDFQKGTNLGLVPAFTDKARQFDLYKNDLVLNQIGKQLKGMGSRVGSDLFKKLVSASKLSRAQSEEGYTSISKNMKNVIQRGIDENKFYAKAIENGATRYTPVSNSWIEHVSDYPIQDPNTNEALPQNLNQWQPYATKEAVEASHNNQRVMPLGHNPPTIPSIHLTPESNLSPQTLALIDKIAKQRGYTRQQIIEMLKRQGKL